MLWLFSIWSNLEGWKSLISECLISWPKIKKNCHFDVSFSLILHNSNEPFLHWIAMWEEKWILSNNQWWSAQRLDQGAATKHFPKPKLAPKKGHGHWRSAASMIHSLQLSESWWNHYIREVCWANRWYAIKTAMPAASIGQQNESNSPPQHPTTMSYNQTVKSWTNWATQFCLVHHIHLTSHQLTTISSNILTIFCREKHLHNQQEAENDFQEFIKSWSRDFYATGINKLNSRWQRCVDCNGSYFD